jgi:hypothetical protein
VGAALGFQASQIKVLVAQQQRIQAQAAAGVAAERRLIQAAVVVAAAIAGALSKLLLQPIHMQSVPVAQAERPEQAVRRAVLVRPDLSR